MADKRISELNSITGANTASGDLFVIVDVDASETKKITRDELTNALELTDFDNIDINGGTIDGTTIGGSTPAAGSFTTITGSGDMNIDSGTLFVDASSNEVGIGTTDPQGELHIRADTPSLYIQSDDGEACDIIFGDETDQSEGRIRYDSSDNMIFQVNNLQEAMRIDSSGNLLVGTTSAFFNSSGRGLLEVNGSTNALIALKANDTSVAYIHNTGTNLNIQNNANADFILGTNAAEAMRIDSSGTLCINRTTSVQADNVLSIQHAGSGSPVGIQSGWTSGAAKKCIAFVNGSGTESGFISVTSATAVSYASASDYRLKENVVPISESVNRVKALKPSRFNFIDDPNKTVDGFLAHEAQEVVPEAVTGEKDAVDKDGKPEYQGIDQSKLVPLLTAALQEAIGRIETLEAEVAALKGA